MRFLAYSCLACLAVSLPGGAKADFFFEGLQPFSIRACVEAQPYTDPVVAPTRGPVIIEGTPSAFNDGDVPRFYAFPCLDRQPKGKASVRRAAPRHVHQK